MNSESTLSKETFLIMLENGMLANHLTVRKIWMLRGASRSWRRCNAFGQPLVPLVTLSYKAF